MKTSENSKTVSLFYEKAALKEKKAKILPPDSISTFLHFNQLHQKEKEWHTLQAYRAIKIHILGPKPPKKSTSILIYEYADTKCKASKPSIITQVEKYIAKAWKATNVSRQYYSYFH